MRILIFLMALLAGSAHALTPVEVRAIATGETDARIEALNKAVADGDDRTAAFIQALADDAVKVAGDKVLLVRDGKAIDPATGAASPLPADAEDVISNNRMRGEIDTALAALKLFSRDERQRAEAVKVLRNDSDESRLPLIEKAYAAEPNPQIKEQLGLVRAGVLLGSTDKSRRLDAARLLGQSRNPNTKTLLIERLKVESDSDVKAALQASPRTSPSCSLICGLGSAA